MSAVNVNCYKMNSFVQGIEMSSRLLLSCLIAGDGSLLIIFPFSFTQEVFDTHLYF